MSNINPELIDGLLIKVILGEETEEEASIVEGWVRSGESNRRYFEDFKRIWMESQGLAVESEVDENEAWVKFKKRVGSGDASVPGDASAPVVSMRWLSVAAIILVLVTGGFIYYEWSYKPSLAFALESGANTIRDTLEDGTVVTLNRHSRLTGLKYFTKGDRVVELEGEAFFEVASDKSRPFFVRTKGAVIKVLGTSFNVRNSVEGTEVIVESGQVLVGRESELVPVKSKEKVVVGSGVGGGASKVEGNSDELYNYYRTKEFVCNGVSLGRLVEVLNAAYGAHIEVEDSAVAGLRLTTTFRDGSLDEILLVVGKTLNLYPVRKDGRIILKKHD